jgi:hypothetical protein
LIWIESNPIFDRYKKTFILILFRRRFYFSHHSLSSYREQYYFNVNDPLKIPGKNNSQIAKIVRGFIVCDIMHTKILFLMTSVLFVVVVICVVVSLLLLLLLLLILVCWMLKENNLNYIHLFVFNLKQQEGGRSWTESRRIKEWMAERFHYFTLFSYIYKYMWKRRIEWSVVWKSIPFETFFQFHSPSQTPKTFSLRSLVLSMHTAYAYESKLWWTHSLSLFFSLEMSTSLSLACLQLYDIESGVLQQEILKSKAIEIFKNISSTFVAWKMTIS